MCAHDVTLVVRGHTLADSMSNYLRETLAATEIRLHTEVVDGAGAGRLEITAPYVNDYCFAYEASDGRVRRSASTWTRVAAGCRSSVAIPRRSC